MSGRTSATDDLQEEEEEDKEDEENKNTDAGADADTITVIRTVINEGADRSVGEGVGEVKTETQLVKL